MLEGEGSIRIGASVRLPRLSSVLVSPDELRQIFNDGDATLWLVGRADEAANTLEMSAETLARCIRRAEDAAAGARG